MFACVLKRARKRAQARASARARAHARKRASAQARKRGQKTREHTYLSAHNYPSLKPRPLLQSLKDVFTVKSGGNLGASAALNLKRKEVGWMPASAAGVGEMKKVTA